MQKEPGKPPLQGFGRKTATPGGGRGCMFFFGLPFLAGGCFFLWIGGLQPIFAWFQSRSWEEVPCRILTSEVVTDEDSDGDTYRVGVTYLYTFAGQDYTGERYDLHGAFSSGYGAKSEIVDSLPPGTQTVCYVDPREPSASVLRRHTGWLPAFAIPFSSIFIVVGLGLMFGGLGSPKTPGQAPVTGFRRGRAARSAPAAPVLEEGALELKPAISRGGMLGASLFLALFWNGIVGIFVFNLVRDLARGRADWFGLLFMIPFVLIGLFLFGLVGYAFLAQFNPTIRLTLNPGTPRLGETCTLTWEAEGDVRRLRRLRVFLEAMEKATYTRGTDTVTDTRIFEQVKLVDSDDAATGYSGKIEFTLPLDSLPSFAAPHNVIEWSLVMEGDIPRWPNINSHFPLRVFPPRPA